MSAPDYDDHRPSHYSRDPAVKRRLAEHHTKWRSIRELRSRMSKADLAEEENRLAEEAKAFLARRDAECESA